MTAGAEDLDLTDPPAVLARTGHDGSNPLTADEQAEVARAKAGDFTRLSALDERCNWITL